MKKIMMFLVSVLFTISVNAQTPTHKWHKVIDAIAHVESRKNPKAVSPCGRYVGYLQISQILVRECNRIAGYKKYTYKDRYNKKKSIAMFVDYQNHHNKEADVEKAIRLWNSGDINCMQQKAKTEKYYQRVMRNMVM